MYRLTAFLVVLPSLLAVLTCKDFFPNKDNAKFQEVQRLFESIPKYPGSQEVETSWDSKEVIARVGATYRVDADYSKVKDYYVSTLERLSWKFEEERQLKNWFGSFAGYELSFSNGEFYVKLEYKGDKSEYGWDYGLSVGWRYGKTRSSANSTDAKYRGWAAVRTTGRARRCSKAFINKDSKQQRGLSRGV